MELLAPGCRKCQHHGINFPDGTRACPTHTTPSWAEQLAVLDQRAKKITPQGWPYGADIDVRARIALLDWAEPLGLKRSTSRCNALHWLRSGRCPNTVECSPLGWMDHTTRWTINSKPALVLTQPYRDADWLRQQTNYLAQEEDLRIEITPGWYGHGTTGVFVWRV